MDDIKGLMAAADALETLDALFVALTKTNPAPRSERVSKALQKIASTMDAIEALRLGDLF